MYLIMSAAYVNQDLASEFGNIPPSFLPLGNKRLFQHQINRFDANSRIALSVPESYKLLDFDKEWLINKKIELVFVPENISLGASLCATINLLDEFPSEEPLHILFGDTLVDDINSNENRIDIIGVSIPQDNYQWSRVDENENIDSMSKEPLTIKDEKIINGYFRISKPLELIRFITKAGWNFFDGLNLYKENYYCAKKEFPEWLDFGHVNTYYNSKAKFTTQRAFNELSITSDLVEKKSYKNNKKIKAESAWFKKLPESMRLYTPQYLGDSDINDVYSYKLEYLHYTSLNELFVFSELPSLIWNKILKQCILFIKKCYEFKCNEEEIDDESLSEFINNKTMIRLQEYCSDKQISLNDMWNYNDEYSISLNELISKVNSYLPKNNIDKTLIHGDFCFSNILYDFRSDRIKTIDPRGITNRGELSIYGDVRYDIAKLSHSIIGLYDVILSGYYHVKIEGGNIRFKIQKQENTEIQDQFINVIKDDFGISKSNLIAMQIHLFLSMLPLHSDNKERQDALFSNAFRLYKKLKDI